jgi:hypothetical protein
MTELIELSRFYMCCQPINRPFREMERFVRRREFRQDRYWQDTPADRRMSAEPKGASETSERPPAPGELLFEAGIVLALALGVAVAAELLLSALDIPRI